MWAVSTECRMLCLLNRHCMGRMRPPERVTRLTICNPLQKLVQTMMELYTCSDKIFRGGLKPCTSSYPDDLAALAFAWGCSPFWGFPPNSRETLKNLNLPEFGGNPKHVLGLRIRSSNRLGPLLTCFKMIWPYEYCFALCIPSETYHKKKL